MEIDVELQVNAGDHGLAVHIHNQGLDPLRECQVNLLRLDRYVARHGDFTRNRFEAVRVLYSREVQGQAVSSADVVGVFEDSQKSSITFGGAPIASNYRKGPVPRWSDEAIWLAEFSIQIDGEELRKEVQFLHWKPGRNIEVVSDPRIQVASAAVSSRPESDEFLPGNLIVEQSREIATQFESDQPGFAADSGSERAQELKKEEEDPAPETATQGRVTLSRRKSGPKQKRDENQRIANIVSRVSDNWRDNLAEICSALDLENIAIPKTWRKDACESWTDGLDTRRGLVVKALDYRLKQI